MFKRLFSLFALLAVTSCSYIMDDTIQYITVETPGARNAVCHAYIDQAKYKIRPPQKVALKKDRDPMVLDCIAPGNRRKQVEIEPKVEPSASLNIVNGVIPGTSWDYLSDAMFSYPEVIYVDFRGIEVTPMGLPAHNSSDLRAPEDYDLEEFLPADPRMNSDKFKTPVEIRRRGEYIDDGFADTDDSLAPINLDPSNDGGKGELMKIETQGLPAQSSTQIFPVE